VKILFAASEAKPFIASGGLADVAGSLPAALKAHRVDCRVILPLYADIAPEMREKLTYLTNFEVELAWRRQYCGLFSAKHAGVTYYFIDNEYYFKRSGIYGHFDDAERFAFFSMAVLESVRHLDFAPDVIHCNDWQTALVPVFLNCFYRGIEELRNTRTLLTIHNIQYQGRFGEQVAGDVLGLPEDKREIVMYDGDVNFMKGGIDQCDAVSTVSPSYAKEILDPWFAHGLDRLLCEREYKLSGILNGIDVKDYDPENDPAIAAHFSADDLTGKAMDKAALQAELGLDQDDRSLVIGMVTRMVSHKGLDLVKYIGSDMMRLPVQLVALGFGDYMYENYFRGLQESFPGRVRMVTGFAPQLARKIYAGSDVFLMPSKSEPCGLAQMIALRYGTIPVVRETGGLKDTVRDLGGENGNGFTFKTYNAHDMLGAVERAYGLFCNKPYWEAAMKAAMACDNSWSRSAVEYRELYKRIIG